MFSCVLADGLDVGPNINHRGAACLGAGVLRPSTAQVRESALLAPNRPSLPGHDEVDGVKVHDHAGAVDKLCTRNPVISAMMRTTGLIERQIGRFGTASRRDKAH